MAITAIHGIEQVRWAPASSVGVVSEGAWKKLENIAMGSVTFTEGTSTKTDIMVEDKDVAAFSVYTPAEGDVLSIATIDHNPELLQVLYNVDWTAATSSMDFKASKKIANMAFEITTRAVSGRKTILTVFNTQVQTTSDGAITKDGTQNKVLTATLMPYRPAGKTDDYIYSKKIVGPNGEVINSTAA